jgi:monovalent cation:H+ antiporter-2, CPA2 family
MAAGQDFILDLTTVLGSSALGGYIANRWRQPVLLGYLVSGLIVGPFGLKLLSEIETINALATVGVAFLLFALGVEFSIAELKRVKDIAISGSLLQIGITMVSVALIATAIGWVGNFTQGIFLGAILSLSSTAVVLKTLTERGETNTVHGQVMLAILIAQDLALGLMLAFLPALNEPENILNNVLAALIKASLFFAGAFLVGKYIVPSFIKTVATTESGELFLLTTIALCLGVALTTAALGLSIEMGAFVAGLMIAEIDYADQALAKILPLRDTFASLFFASIGMLIDPLFVWENLGTILGLVALVMIGKAVIILPIVLKFGYSFKTAVIAGLGLNQIGEFSFVLALVALNGEFITREEYLLLLGTTAITLVLTPVGMKWSPWIADRLAEIPILATYLSQFRSTKSLSVPETIRDHVVVAGYGRVGQVLAKMISDRGYPILVVDNSEAAIKHLQQEQIPYIFGDGDSELVLEKAHLEKAKALAIALPDPASTRLLLKRALEFAPELDVVARSHDNSEIDILTQLGAREVVQPEFEAALEMGAHMLETLGEPIPTIQSVIQAIRLDRYNSVRPEMNLRRQQREVTDMTTELHSEWVTLTPNSPLNQMTLAASDIRNQTGVTVMAITQGSSTIYYPNAQTILNSGDKLLAIGNPQEVAALQSLILGKCVLDGKSHYWVTLTENSPLLGMKPSDVQQQYEVAIQALRRNGKLYSNVDRAMKLQLEDCILLRGQPDRAEQVKKLATG